MAKFKIISNRATSVLVVSLLIISLILLSLWWQAGRWYKDKLIAEIKAGSTVDLMLHANVLATSINRRFALLEGLYAFTLINLDIEKLKTNFDTFASGLYVSAKGIRNLVIAPGGINKFVYPIERNETVYGHDQINDYRPNVRIDVQNTINSRQVVLSGPYELRQGGLGLVARKAVFIDNKFWGLISMVLDMEPVIACANFETGHFNNYSIGIRDDEENVFYGDDQAFSSEGIAQRIELPDGYWEIAQIPIAGWDATVHDEVMMFKIKGLIIVMLITLSIYLLLSRQSRLASMVRKQTHKLLEVNDDLENDIKKRKQVEYALQEEEQRLIEAQKIALLGRWDLNLTNNQLQWSEGIFDLFEIDPDKFEASYEAFLEAIHPDDRERVNLAYSKSLKNKLPYEISHRLLMKDGRIKWVLEKCRTEYDLQGNALRSIGIIQDITERKLAEKELAKHGQHLEELVKERTKELEEKNKKLEEFNDLFVDREFRIKELKDKVKELDGKK